MMTAVRVNNMLNNGSVSIRVSAPAIFSAAETMEVPITVIIPAKKTVLTDLRFHVPQHLQLFSNLHQT